ncbi:MAG: hypothetical protein MRERV_28c029 [Mycoplasmataceae bacterium RV_VA103A]|nr:MAG: hypothetical protein MRERV_28c029 [Mycoplasmataceae bacterium RV_VA103A]
MENNINQGYKITSNKNQLGDYSAGNNTIELTSVNRETDINQGLVVKGDENKSGNINLSENIYKELSQSEETTNNVLSEPVQEVQQDQSEKGLTNTEEIKKDKPSWKERRDCQIATATLVVTLLTGAIVPIVLKVTGKV